MFGWAGNILKVDLSRSKIFSTPLTREMGRKFIGGRGLNAKFLFDEVPPRTDAFHPENRLIFGTGPLVGTLVPGSCRLNVTCRSPLGFLGDSNTHGFWSPELKFAGFDHVVVSGKAERPTYLWIQDGEVELRDASHLWGKDIRETRRIIRKDHQDRAIQIACIGQGGESLVRFACVSASLESYAGRTGCGAVMGSKNLKAIAVRGSKGVQIADPERFLKTTRAFVEGIKESGAETRTYRRLWYKHQNKSMLPTKHHQAGWWEDIDKLDPEIFYAKHVIKSWSNLCPGVDCQPIYMIKEGPYKGTYGSVEYEGVASFGSNVANTDLDSVLKANELADSYGVDADSCGRVISFAMELVQRGIITEKDVGFPLEWGDSEAVIKLINMIVARQGFGDILAEGEARAGKIIGRGAEKYVLVIKGLEQHETCRANIGCALAQAVSTRGSDHLRGDPPEGKRATAELIEKMFGFKDDSNPLQYERKAFMVTKEEVHSMLVDSLEICKRFGFWQPHIYKWIKDDPPGSLYAELFSSATGVEMGADELLRAAERSYNVERAFIVREGVRRKDDYQTWREYQDPLPSGHAKGAVLDREKYSQMLDEYYRCHGWDVETGIPTKSKLEELELEEVIESLFKLSILPKED